MNKKTGHEICMGEIWKWVALFNIHKNIEKFDNLVSKTSFSCVLFSFIIVCLGHNDTSRNTFIQFGNLQILNENLWNHLENLGFW